MHLYIICIYTGFKIRLMNNLTSQDRALKEYCLMGRNLDRLWAQYASTENRDTPTVEVKKWIVQF